MKDQFDREIDYLRISVTDLCNLRCRYCMPEKGIEKRSTKEVLRYEEIIEITRAAANLGVRKVRLTGGEPLVRRDMLTLCRGIKAISGIRDLALTTNGTLLSGMADSLKMAGIGRVNISIDTLDARKYAEITRGGILQNVQNGIHAALRVGLAPVKLNTVLIGGFNDDEIEAFVSLTKTCDIEVRFIELMPIGEGAPYWKSGYLPNSVVLEKIPELTPVSGDENGTAKLYALPGAKGKVGLISPVSSHFCGACNRLRLTSDGMLKPCLHSDMEIPVRGLRGAELEHAIERAILRKPCRGSKLNGPHPSPAGRRMNQIGG